MVIHIKWDNNSKGIILPVNPSGFTISDSMNNTSVNIHNLGEINLKGKRNLQTITIDSFFPAQKYNFLQTAYHDPYDYYIKKLSALFERNETVHLVITQTDINGYFTIEQFDYGHAEKTHDVSYTLSLKEYREVAKKSTAKGRVAKSKKTTSYKWNKGDTWASLTKKTLGSSTTWKTQRKNNIATVNKAKRKKPKVKEATALIGYKVVIKA